MRSSVINLSEPSTDPRKRGIVYSSHTCDYLMDSTADANPVVQVKLIDTCRETCTSCRSANSDLSTPARASAEEAFGFCCSTRQRFPESAVEERVPGKVAVIHPLRSQHRSLSDAHAWWCRHSVAAPSVGQWTKQGMAESDRSCSGQRTPTHMHRHPVT